MLHKYSLLFCLLLVSTTIFAQQKPRVTPPMPPKPPAPPAMLATAKPTIEYKYESAKNDPLNTRIYTLPNGFKVYLSVNKKCRN